MLKATLEEDVKTALREKNERRRDTLRLLLSAIRNEEIEARSKGKSELGDEDGIRVLQREAKKRKESIEAYRAGGREDLVAGEEAELKIIETYLPASMSESEVEKIVRGVIGEIKPEGSKDFGRVMSEAVRRIAGRAEGAVVKRIVESCMKKEA